MMSEITPTRGRRPRRRWLMAVGWALGGYVALAVLSTGIMFAGVVVSRALGNDPRANDESLPGHQASEVGGSQAAGRRPTQP
jgi:hypothetical protein